MQSMSGSERCISILNFATMLLSIPVLTTGFWLASKHDSECTRFLQTPIMCIGLFMLLLSMAGFVGSCWTVRWLLWIYLFVMFLLIVALLCFTTFALIVTSNESPPASSSSYSDRQATNQTDTDDTDSVEDHQYQLSSYSGWLAHRVRNNDNWRKIKSCLVAANICATDGTARPSFVPKFLYTHLNSLQIGCCKPPAVCEYTLEDGGVWADPMNATASPDCGSWSNEARVQCMGCSTCKAGLLANLRRDWSKVALVNAVALALILLVYALACCVFHNASQKRRLRLRRRHLHLPDDPPKYLHPHHHHHHRLPQPRPLSTFISSFPLFSRLAAPSPPASSTQIPDSDTLQANHQRMLHP